MNDIYVYVVTEVHEAAQHIADSSRVRDDKDFSGLYLFCFPSVTTVSVAFEYPGKLMYLSTAYSRRSISAPQPFPMLVFVMFNFG